jgi:hypothetical protein
MEAKKHSKLGIASFVIGVMITVSFSILYIADINMKFSKIGLFCFLIIGVSGGLGINGVAAKNKKKIFAYLGLMLSVAPFFIILGVTT